MRDVDKYIQEERKRNPDVNMLPTHGWIYKKADELAQELLGITSDKTIRRRIKDLVEKGWLEERRNPNYKWDRTWQYHVNIKKIQFDLFEKGLFLEGYSVQFDFTKRQNDLWKETDDAAIPEITTEITTDILDPAIKIDNNIHDDEQNFVSSLVQVAEPVDDFEAQFPKRFDSPPPERQYDLSTPEGRAEAQVKSIENRVKRPMQRPWLNWFPKKVYPRDGISKESLQRVGWLFEEVTGRVPKSDKEWHRWKQIYATMYLEANGKFELLEEVFHKKWDNPEFRTYDPQKYIDAIGVAVAENKDIGDGKRLNESLVLR
jgi:hypothetical protein